MSDEIRFKGILETMKNTEARGLSEFSVQSPPPKVLERMKSAGLTWRQGPSRNGRQTIIVSVPVETTTELEPVQPETP